MPESQKKMSRFKSNLPDGVQLPFILIQVLAIISCVVAVIGYFFAPPQIPLFYSLAQPTQQLVAKELIFTLPGIAVLFAFSNSLLILRLKKYDVLLIRLFAWITIVFVFILLFALIRILYIVT